ncbi:hypothetical protein ALC56_10260 [Trachymyrmex septentrionalis]|uniref:Uncharacterized protein n=1 Tax=Trachymyrmex septentrionalis TaxID=34720 RepID=A0A195F4B9_9HYME|nr:hypothetical protein ALC56_10260 [Trachymyrmex septentrionalis]
MTGPAWGSRFCLVLAAITIVIANYPRHRNRHLREQLVNSHKVTRNITQLQEQGTSSLITFSKVEHYVAKLRNRAVRVIRLVLKLDFHVPRLHRTCEHGKVSITCKILRRDAV